MSSTMLPRIGSPADLHQLSEFGVLEAYGARGHFRDERPAVSVHESPAQDEILKPTPRRGAPHRALPVALPFGVHLLCGECCVAFDIRFVLFKRAHCVMQQISAHTPNLAGVA